MIKKSTNRVRGHLSTFYDVNGVPTNFDQDFVNEDWTLQSENHPGWHRKRRRHPRDVGGPFDLIKRETLRYPSGYFEVNDFPGGGSLRKQGLKGQFIVGTDPVKPSEVPYDISQWGPIAYDRMKPTKPSFQGWRELFELRDLTSLLKQRFTKDLFGAANGHLAIQFGWLPLLSSLQSLYKAQKTWQKRLNWLIDHNGTPIRTRKYLFADSITSPRTVQTKSPYLLGIQPAIDSRFSAATLWQQSDWSSESWQVWASARFRYWLPEGPHDVEWTNKMKRRLFGIQYSPSQVYEALPWTWLVDWFFNWGSVLRNVEAGVADRLAADHFYLMCTNIRANYRELSFTVKNSDWGPGGPTSARTEVRWIHKQRVKGDPFGWNTNPATLSGMQLSILGALGISRLG